MFSEGHSTARPSGAAAANPAPVLTPAPTREPVPRAPCSLGDATPRPLGPLPRRRDAGLVVGRRRSSSSSTSSTERELDLRSTTRQGRCRASTLVSSREATGSCTSSTSGRATAPRSGTRTPQRPSSYPVSPLPSERATCSTSAATVSTKDLRRSGLEPAPAGSGPTRPLQSSPARPSRSARP